MIEYTTPDFVFRVKDDNVDLTEANHVYLTLKQGEYELTKTDDELLIERNKVSLWLSQNEVSSFKCDKFKIEVQLNWTYEEADGERIKRAATKIKSFQITRNLLKRVVR